MVPSEADPRAAFEQRLAREILAAERFRATLLAVLPTVTMLAFLAVSSAYPDVVTALLHGKFDRAPVGLFLCAVAGFEFHVLYATERMLKNGQRPSAARRYGYAFVETSLPTLVIVYYATILGPVQALLMPSAFVYFVFILLSTLRLDFALSAFTGLVAAVEYAALALFWGSADTTVAEPVLTSLPQHLAKACILLVAGIAAGFVAGRLRSSFSRAIQSLEERSRILGVFGQHVSPEVVQRLVAPGESEAKSEQRDVCVMFLDIRGFTAFAEKRSPEEVVAYLNVIFDDAVEAVVAHHGIVNKFLGDGFMAVFGVSGEDGSSACSEAVAAGLDVLDRIDKLVTDAKIPSTRVGLGLHAGPAVVGNIGSVRRKEYTVIGDVVNVAARVEALNKELGTTMLVTEEVWRNSGRSEETPLSRAPLHVRGREMPVRIFQLA
ncbi:MAG TPA: adenylate/guanylate cyclase domain-containing protein [Polyangiaceae bacterium]|nr:adenylate/guanylate cyclase domain-containing protein [Polyangiaceae bacterium]